jgi:hypothetical protein
MKIKHLLSSILFILFLQLKSFSQDNIIFNIPLNKDGQKYLISRGIDENKSFAALIDFLDEEFNSIVVFADEKREDVFYKVSSFCNIVNVRWNTQSLKRDIGAVGRIPMEVTFSFCNGDKLNYDFTVNINGYTYDLKMAILRALRKNIPVDEIVDKLNTVKLPVGAEVINLDSIKTTTNNTIEENIGIEGVYKIIESTNFTSLSKVMIKNIGDQLLILNLESKAFTNDWKKGQVIAKIQKTSSSKYYIGMYRALNSTESDISLTYDDNLVEIVFTQSKETLKFIKLTN